MAHYAFLDENNVVVNVIPGKDENEDGIDWEEWYSNFSGMSCKRTSLNTMAGIHLKGGVPFRKNYAVIGGIYSTEKDAFISKKPFESWLLNEATCCWEAPIPVPDDGKPYRWDESTLSWNLL